MGVPKFFKWLSETQPFPRSIQDELPPNIGILHIDLNQIIHDAVGEENRDNPVQTVNGILVINPMDLYNRRAKVFQRVLNRILDLVRYVNPQDSLYIAVDGVAPYAKIAIQQRGRRFKSAADRSPTTVFDSNQINPGTDFMVELDQFLRAELERATRDRTIKMPPYTLYSPHTVPGEGEHKIADYLRNMKGGGRSVMVYGSDADLWMIYLSQLSLGYSNIYLYREANRRTVFVNLGIFAQIIQQIYPGVPSPLMDFVVILALNGNDFLPHFPVFERIADALSVLIFGYTHFLKAHPGKGITDNSSIVWTNLADYLQYIRENNNDMLLQRWGENQDNLIKKQSAITESCVSSVHEVDATTMKSTCRRTFDVEKFNSLWYKYALMSKVGKSKIEPNQEDINRMLQKYCEGLLWVHNYYRYGIKSCNIDWYYPYDYSPLFSDLPQYIRSGQQFALDPIYSRGEFLHPLQQIVAVMPLKSLSIVPIPLRVLFTNQSPLIDIYPEQFLVDDTGKMESWQSIALLPIPTPERIRYAFDMLKLPKEYLDQFVDTDKTFTRGPITAIYNPGPSNRGRGRGRGRGRS